MAAAVLLAAAVVAGCTNGVPGDPARSSSGSAAPPAGMRSQQTLWRVAGQGAYLPDTDKDVAAVRALVIKHADVVGNRSSGTIEASAATERAAYSSRFLTQLDGQAYGAKLVRLYRDAGLSISQVQLSWYPSTMAADRATAEAHVGSTFVVTAASDRYLSDNRLSLGSRYEELRRVGLVRTPAGWRIDTIEKAPLRTVAGPPAPSS